MMVERLESRRKEALFSELDTLIDSGAVDGERVDAQLEDYENTEQDMSEVQTSMRMDADTIAILDAMIPLLKSHPTLKYARASRALAIRAAIDRGLEALAAELGTTVDALRKGMTD